jgi:hypothetical protein
MSWTEPAVAKAFVTGVLTSHKGILSRIELREGEQAGNSITIPYFSSGTVASANVDAITASSRNDAILTFSATDKLRRTALKPSEQRAYLNDPSMGEKLIEEHVDSLRKALEDALDTEMATSTNTVSLTTDSTFTMALFTKGLADPLDAGCDMSELTFISDAAGWSSCVAAGFANTGGSVAGLQGALGMLYGSIPAIVSANCTCDVSAGPAGYLWAKRGIICVLGDVAHYGGNFSTATASFDYVTTISYAFDTVGGASSKLVVKFLNA